MSTITAYKVLEIALEKAGFICSARHKQCRWTWRGISESGATRYMFSVTLPSDSYVNDRAQVFRAIKTVREVIREGAFSAVDEQDRLIEKFTRRETPKQRATRIRRKVVDLATERAVRKALGMSEPRQ